MGLKTGLGMSIVGAVQQLCHAEIASFEPPTPQRHALNHENVYNYHRDRPVSMRTTHPLGVT